MNRAKSLIFLLLVMSFSTNASAEIISWIDEAGVVHFTDQFSNVPQKYENIIKIRDDSGQEPTSISTVPPEPKHKLKSVTTNSKQMIDRNASGITDNNQSNIPDVYRANFRDRNHDRNLEAKKYRRKIQEDTRRSQADAYNSQSDARKATIDAENKINKAANVGPKSINDAHQAQQRAQDLINKARNTGTSR